MRKQIPSDSKEVLRELLRFRGALEQVESHAQVAIPAVYKLVVTAAVYAYFALTLVARQNIGRGQREGHEEEEEEVDLFFPVFVVFKLVLLVGWLKVAKSIENPFGEDDVDFEMFPLLRRHLRVIRTNVPTHKYYYMYFSGTLMERKSVKKYSHCPLSGHKSHFERV